MTSNPADSENSRLRQEIVALRGSVELERQRAAERERRDRIERLAAENAMRRANRQLQMMSDCNQALIRATDEVELLNTICDIAVSIGGYRLAWVGSAEHDAAMSVRPIAHAGVDDGYIREIRVTWSEAESGRGPVGMAIRTAEPCPFQNIAENPLFAPWRDPAMQRGYASVCGLPLIIGGEVWGALGIYCDLPNAFDPEEVRLLSELAGDLAFGISVLRARHERRLAEQALIASEERFKWLLQNSNDIIATIDDKFVYMSASGPVESLLGFKPEELVGTVCTDSIHPDDLDTARTQFFEELKKPDAVRRLEYRVRHRDGTWSYLEAVGTNRLNEAVVRGIVLNIRDISERKRGETERDKLQNQLQQAMKMEAVGRLAGGIAHDFNNLLTVVNGNIELARLTLGPTSPVVQQLDEVASASQSAASLTRQLLSFSRRQIIEPRAIDLNRLIENLQRMLVRLIGEDVTLRTQLAEPLAPVFVDPGQFEQVLVNLAVNARDAMPTGGQLSIETNTVDLGSDMCLRYPNLQPGPFVLLVVSDTGHGMTEEVRLRLFEPFFTTKPKGQGTGLGLATIFGAVSQAGGAIEVMSEINRGSTFRIYLPRAVEPAEKVETVGRGPVMSMGQETVLLVEDDVNVRELTSRILERLGYRVLVAENGSAALTLAAKFEDRIDLLMTDVVMPDVNGRELAEKVLERRAEIKVLFASGYTENLVIHDDVVDKNLNFIAKPYSMQALAGKLREVLGPTRR